MEIKKLLLVMAMEHEASPLVEALPFKKCPPFHEYLPQQIFHKIHRGMDIWLVVNGKDPAHNVDCVGSQPAILSTSMGIQHFQPDLVVSLGTAGGRYMHGGRVGEVYVSENPIYFHDRIIPIPGFEAYGSGGYNSVDVSQLAKDLNLKQGIFSSGDSLYHSEETQKVFDDHGAVIKEMEAASVAWVAQMFKVPFFGIKVISDLIDTDIPVGEQFLSHFDNATDLLKDKTIEVLDYLAQKSVEELGQAVVAE